jgi:hypothetical protein
MKTDDGAKRAVTCLSLNPHKRLDLFSNHPYFERREIHFSSVFASGYSVYVAGSYLPPTISITYHSAPDRLFI